MFLLDTNVVSELRKIRLDRADKNVADFKSSGVVLLNPWEAQG